MIPAICFECDQPAEHDHHVVPVSRGGTKTVPLCGPCHAKAHHRDGNMAHTHLTKAAMQAKIARGERCGKVRYGYDLAADGTTLVRNEREQRVIVTMNDWRAAGKTYREVAALLGESKVRTKNGGKTWTPATVRRILSRDGLTSVRGPREKRKNVCDPNRPRKARTQEQNDSAKRALQAKIARGERCGKIRYGYDLAGDGKMLVRNEQEQEVILTMRSWKAQGKSYRDLVKLVEGLGIETKEGNRIWLPATIRRILTRPVA
jgi:hypothetical protein